MPPSQFSAWEIPRASAQQLLALHRAVGFKVEEQGVLERLVKETSCSDKGKKVPASLCVTRVLVSSEMLVPCAGSRWRVSGGHVDAHARVFLEQWLTFGGPHVLLLCSTLFRLAWLVMGLDMGVTCTARHWTLYCRARISSWPCWALGTISI